MILTHCSRAGEHKGPEAVKQAFIDGIGSMLDSNKPTSYTVTNAIGGGDVPWVCIEAVSTAKNVTGKSGVRPEKSS